MRSFSLVAVILLVLVAGAAAATDASSNNDNSQVYIPVGSPAPSTQFVNPFTNRLRQLFRQPAGRLSLLSLLEGLLPGSATKTSGGRQATAAAAAAAASLGSTAAVDADTAAAASVAIADAAAAATSGGRDWPLTDEEIDAINKLFGDAASSQGLYQYNTGVPSLQQLLTMNTTTAAQLVKTLSGDRLQQLAGSPEAHGYIVRTFVISGDALLKLHLTTDLQLVIRDIISEELEAATYVPSGQVLTFASSNVSVSLAFNGVAFQNAGPLATPENHQGLAAVRDALSQLAGGFDPNHIAVSFSALPAPSESAAALSVHQGRRLLGKPQQQQEADAPVTVYARFFNIDPANATSVAGALGKMCNSATAAFNSSATRSSLPEDKQVSPICSSVFTAEFAQHGVPLSFGKLSVTAVGQPQANVALSVAVALTPNQAVNATLINKTRNWLNSTALHDILDDLDLTAETLPTDLYLESGQSTSGSSSLVSDLNLPGLITSILGQPATGQGEAAASAAGAVVSKGMIAGIAIAAVTSVLALVGVAVLLVMRRPTPAKTEDKDALPTTNADGTRRKKRRPRLYHAKFMTSGPGCSSSSAVQASLADTDAHNHSVELPSVYPRSTLERGDSVTSAVQFEADEAAAEGDQEASDQQRQAQPGSNRTSTSSSCSNGSNAGDSGAGCSSSSSMQSQQQQGVELQLKRAAGPYHGSGIASAYSLAHSRAMSSMTFELGSSYGSSRDIHWASAAASQPEALESVTREGCSPSERLPTIYSQEQQYFCPAGGSAGATVVDAAAVFSVMEAHMAVSERSGASRCTSSSSTSSTTSLRTVQPLGLSCWHSSGHTSLASSLGSSLVILQQEQLEQQQWRQEQHAVSPFAAASPFAAVQNRPHQHQQISGSGAVSPFSLEHQEQQQQRPANTAAAYQFMLSQQQLEQPMEEEEQQVNSSHELADFEDNISSHTNFNSFVTACSSFVSRA